MHRGIGMLTAAVSLLAALLGSVLAVSHVVPWALLGFIWLGVIGLFAGELAFAACVHGNNRPRWNGSAFALLCLLVVASLSVMVGTRVQSTLTGGTMPWDTRTYSLPVSGNFLTPPGVSRVYIRVVNADVSVIGTNNEATRYQGELSVRTASAALARQTLARDWTVSRIGQTMSLDLNTSHTNGFTFATGLTAKGHLTVFLPRRLSVTIRTMNGTVTMANVEGAGVLSTLNGSVRASHLGGALTASTVNGQISVDGERGAVKATTTNGDIRLRHIRGSGRAKAVNGSIDASITTVGGNWTLSTVHGGVQLHLPNAARNLSVTADAPHIHFFGGNWSFEPSSIPHHEAARLGKAIHSVHLQTVNGGAYVLVGRALAP